MKVTTEYMTDLSGFGELLGALFVMAIIPGIGEELVFRGFAQTRLQQIVVNPHIAVWLSAIFFSAYHLQFYGFVPRVLMGALFGYIFLWSGSLPLTMLAHIFNNGFSVIMIALQKEHIVTSDNLITLEIAGIFLIACVTLIHFIKKHENTE